MMDFRGFWCRQVHAEAGAVKAQSIVSIQAVEQQRQVQGVYTHCAAATRKNPFWADIEGVRPQASTR